MAHNNFGKMMNNKHKIMILTITIIIIIKSLVRVVKIPIMRKKNMKLSAKKKIKKMKLTMKAVMNKKLNKVIKNK